MTSLATAIGGMKHWDWCPICRGGLDTGLECDQCGADLMPIYTAFKESLSGSNPGEPKACTPAEERGIVGATGAGQLPDGKPGSTVDSAERRSPDDTTGPSSPDESNRHLSSKSTVWMAKNRAYSETCYFGNYATAVAWAKGGTVIPVEVREHAPPDILIVEGGVPPEPQGPQWIQCSERIPPEDTPVLILRNGELRIGAIFTESPGHEETFKAFNYWDDPNDDGQCWEWHEVTHWMPLPNTPVTKDAAHE